MLPVLILSACGGAEEKKMRFYTRGRDFMDKGNLVKATLELKNAVQIDPRFAEGHYLLAQAEMRRNNLQRAFKSYQRTVELMPGNLDAQAKLGKLYLMQGDRTKAQQKVELILKADPRNQEGLLLKGSVLMARKDWKALAPLADKMIAGGIHQPAAYLMLALAQNGLHDGMISEKTLLEGVRRNPTSIALLRTLVDYYAVVGKVDEAAAGIRQIMALEPDTYAYGINLAGLYWKNNRTTEARQTLATLKGGNLKNQACLEAIAGFYSTRHLPHDAEEILTEGIRAVPHSFTLRFALSELYSALGRSEAAIKVLTECLGIKKDPQLPEVVETKVLLARTYFQRGERDLAERYVAEVLKGNASNIEATFLKGRLHLRNGEGVSAISAFRSVINSRPNDAEAILLLANAYLLNLEPNLALESLHKAELLEPGSLRVTRALVRFSVSRKEYRQAEERMRLYITRHPNDAEAYVELGDVYRLEGDLRRAGAQYEQVKQKYPRLPAPYLLLSGLAAEQDNLPKAIAELTEVVGRLAPDNIPLTLQLANLYARGNQTAKARQIYEGLLVKHAAEWQISNDYACFLADYGNVPADIAQAESLTKKVLAIRPDDPLIIDTLGWIEYRKNNFPRALQLLEVAGGKLSGNQTVNYHLGMASIQAGKKDQARNRLKKALAGGDFPEKKQAMAALQRL